VRIKDTYLWRVGVGFSVLVNAVFYGPAPETLCGRAARARRDGRVWGCVFCRFVDWLDPGHCGRELAFWDRMRRFKR
jgi:hypothetical protein